MTEEKEELVQVNIRMPESLANQAKLAARISGMSLNKYIIKVLDKAISLPSLEEEVERLQKEIEALKKTPIPALLL
ncbi:toxin-antitoxin system HicB family antitoxin [Fischerella sp. PCC 9605]|uniref:toxin-antitoxin system HicB family antitoxin n=1 Tax=Fischerella sp. PCC 9605 TaxID=1173024 RepID=UPI00047CD57C|nr:toxin-antitoxin system HicB family antitoxin [Fischerella sp. PCC 9605]